MSKCFQSGKTYQTLIYQRLCNLFGKLTPDYCIIKEVEGAKSGPDIRLISQLYNIGIECKNKGAFEGGSKKMTYDGQRLVFSDFDSIHSRILDNRIIYQGLNLPWYEGKKSDDEWSKVKSVFEPDIYIEANDNSISEYYKNVGTFYLQIEELGLYHTGDDVFEIGVPYFKCPIKLRIRISKHKKKGIPTDVTGALIYNKYALVKSPYSLDINGFLPKSLKLDENTIIVF